MVGFGSLMRSVSNKVVATADQVVDAGKKAMGDMGKQVALDVLQGQDVQGALQNRALQQKRKLYTGVTAPLSNKRRPRRPKRPPASRLPKSQKKKKKKKRRSQDVFDF